METFPSNATFPSPTLYPTGYRDGGATLPGMPGYKSSEELWVSGTRVTSFRFEVLDNNDILQGVLRAVDNGQVEWLARASVKGRGSLTVTDIDETFLRNNPINWLIARIRPVATIEGDKEYPIGIWIPSAPSEAWNGTGMSWNIEMHDKSSLLDRDRHPQSYTARKDSTVIEHVRYNVLQVDPKGEVSIDSDIESRKLPREMTWEPGTTRLKIVNDLLSAAGCFSIWVDLNGLYRVTDYKTPQQRPVKFESTGPFESNRNSIVSPEYTIDRDIYDIPNRYIAVGQGEEDKPALIGIATNTDPKSPFSFANRGRWITEREDSVEATSQDAINKYASRKLQTLSQFKADFQISHLWMPSLRVNDVVRFTDPRSQTNTLATVMQTEVKFSATEFISSKLTEVTDITTESDKSETLEEGAS